MIFNKKIDIIIPVYNVKKYLRKSIYSIISQHYNNISVILVDDGSTDNSGEICDEYALKYDFIKVIHTKNHGVSHARNIGLEHVTNDYVYFMDSDDYIEPNFLGKLMEQISKDDSDIVGGSFVVDDGDNISKMLLEQDTNIFDRTEIIKEIFSPKDESHKVQNWSLWDKLFKKELVTSVRFNESISMSEDMLFLWQVMKKCHKFSYVPLFGYHYVMRSGSATHSTDAKIAFFDAVTLLYYDIVNESLEIKNTIEELYSICLIYDLWTMLRYKTVERELDIKKAQNFLRQNFLHLLFNKNMTMKKRIAMLLECLPYGLYKRWYLLANS